MTLKNKILALIDDYLETQSYTLQEAITLSKIKRAIEDCFDKIEPEYEENQCQICSKSPTKLKQGKYCLDCFDKYID